MLDRTRRTVTDDHVVVVLLANHELAHARKDTCQLSPCIMRFSAVQAADHAPNGLKRGEGGMRDVLRAHCGRVVAWALHWWTSHWSQVRVEVCLKAEKGQNSGFCVCGVPEMAIFARNSNGAQYSAVICCGFIWIFEWFPRLSSMNVPRIWGPSQVAVGCESIVIK